MPRTCSNPLCGAPDARVLCRRQLRRGRWLPGPCRPRRDAHTRGLAYAMPGSRHAVLQEYSGAQLVLHSCAHCRAGAGILLRSREIQRQGGAEIWKQISEQCEKCSERFISPPQPPAPCLRRSRCKHDEGRGCRHGQRQPSDSAAPARVTWTAARPSWQRFGWCAGARLC